MVSERGAPRSLPLELVYKIIRFVPSSDIITLLSVSSSIRRETQTLRYRHVKLITNESVVKFAAIVHYVGVFVHILAIPDSKPTQKDELQLILHSIPHLAELITGRDSSLRFDSDFLPLKPHFKLRKFVVRGREVIEELLPFIQAQAESLEHLDLPQDLPSAVSISFPRLRALRMHSNARWAILQQGSVVCLSGSFLALLPSLSFSSIRAILCRPISMANFMNLPNVFPNLVFIQASVVRFSPTLCFCKLKPFLFKFDENHFNDLRSLPAFPALEKLRVFVEKAEDEPRAAYLFDLNPRLRSVEAFCRTKAMWHKFRRFTIPGPVEYSTEGNAFNAEWLQYSDDRYETQI